MFINISNHPSTKWTDDQIRAAQVWGEIVNIPFPVVDPTYGTEEVTALAKRIVAKARLAESLPGTAMIQGEASLAWELTRMATALGWRVVVATTDRVVTEGENGVKTATFEFVQFRELRK